MAIHVVNQIPAHVKKLFVIGGDHHLHQHTYGNTLLEGIPKRVYWGLQVLKAGYAYARKYQVPFVLNGDTTHNKNSLDPLVTELLKQLFDGIQQEDGPHIYLIPGNHEKPEKFNKVSTLAAFEQGRVRLVREAMRLTCHGVVDCILTPFAYDHKAQAKTAVDEIKDLPAIFIGHFPVDGANLGKHTLSSAVKFEDFKPDRYIGLLFNDIHKHQAIGTKGYHLGATMQNNFGEVGYDCGWWLLGSDGREVYLQRLPVDAPQFFYTDDETSAEELRKAGHYARVRPQTLVKQMLAEQKKARLEFNMQDLDGTLRNYIKFQVDHGRLEQGDASAILELAQKAMKGLA